MTQLHLRPVLLHKSAKTKIIAIGPLRLNHQYDQFGLSFDDCVNHCKDGVKKCGVVFDETDIRSVQSVNSTGPLIHPLLSSMMAYCNILL